LAPLSTVPPPTTPELVAQVLADYRTPDGPFDDAVFLRTSSQPVDATHIDLRGSVKASSDARYPALRQGVRDAVESVIGPTTPDALAFVEPTFPSMIANPTIDTAAVPPIVRFIGDDNLYTVYGAWPFNSEDFALFLGQVPGAMFLLGVANPALGISGVPHSPNFDADEEAILIGTKAMSAVVWQRLSGG
jgi:metal-dependent amidase/aminoacylase/carboxypeptidase family protein